MSLGQAAHLPRHQFLHWTPTQRKLLFWGGAFKKPHWYLVAQAGACWILGSLSGGSQGIEGYEGQQVLWMLAWPSSGGQLVTKAGSQAPTPGQWPGDCLTSVCSLVLHLQFCLVEPPSYYFLHQLKPQVCPPCGCSRELLKCQTPFCSIERPGQPSSLTPLASSPFLDCSVLSALFSLAFAHAGPSVWPPLSFFLSSQVILNVLSSGGHFFTSSFQLVPLLLLSVIHSGCIYWALFMFWALVWVLGMQQEADRLVAAFGQLHSSGR